MSVEYAILRSATLHLLNPRMGKFKTEKLKILLEQFCNNFSMPGMLPRKSENKIPIRWKRFYLTQEFKTSWGANINYHAHWILADRFNSSKCLIVNTDKPYLKGLMDFLNYYWEIVRYTL